MLKIKWNRNGSWSAVRIARQASLASVALLTGFAISGCVDNPVTGEREIGFVSVERQIKIGAEQYAPAQQMQGGLYRVDPALTAYVQEIGQRLATASGVALPYEFVVLNNPVPNAWALPGGKIAVNRGLLTELHNEAELAAVLGHEIVHAAGRHGAKSMERGMALQAVLLGTAIGSQGSDFGRFIVGGAGAAAGLITQRYGRDAEREADYYGTRYMALAGYDPEAAVALQETFLRLSEGKRSSWVEGLFASHPPSTERVANNQARVAELRAEGLTGGELGAARYAQAIRQLETDAPAYKAADSASKALADGEFSTAERMAREALASQAAEPSFHGLLGDALRERGAYQEAMGAYDEAIELDPEFYGYYLGRGLARKSDGERAAARADFERSVELLPTAVAYNELGRFAESAGEIDSALRFYEQAAQSDTEIGRSARVRGLRLDLPRNPGRYLEARVDRDGYGRLVLSVANPTPVTVVDVAVRIETQDDQGRRAEGIRQVAGIEAGGNAYVVVLGNAAHLVDAGARVVAARAADSSGGP